MANGSATYCLLCAKLKTLAEVIDVENKIDEILNKLTRINATAHLHSVNLPKKVCLKCITFLEGAYDFVLEVERAQHALLDLKPDIKQEICANFEATETVLKVEQEIETIDDDKNPLKFEEDPPASIIEAPANTSISNSTDEKENETVYLINTKRKCKKKVISGDKNPLHYEEDPPAPSIEAPADTSISNSTDEKENETVKVNRKRKCKKKNIGDKTPLHYEEDPSASSIEAPADTSICNSTDEKENETVNLRNTNQKRKKKNVGVDKIPLHYEEDPPAPSIEAPADTSISNSTDEKEKETVKINTKRKCKKKIIGGDKIPIHYEEDPPAPSIEASADTSISNSTNDKENETVKINTKRKCKKKNVGVDKIPLHYEEDPPAPSIEAPADTSISNSTNEKENETTRLNTKPKSKKRTFKLVINSSSSWEDYIWKCGDCDTEFPTHEELKTHAMEIHKCCNVQKCYDCNIRKGKLDQFNKHVQQKHRKPLSYSCYKCFKTFPTPCKAGLHRHTHKPTPYYCKGCNTIFETENQLKDHISTYYRLNIRITSKSDHICETCGKCFINKWVLNAHKRVHTTERPFPCTICPLRFKNQTWLSAHLHLHTAENQYTCDVCSRSFKTKAYLKNHLIVHTNLLPHVCSHCNKGFRFKSLLNQHLRQHTGDKPYTCSICDWKFTGWANWNKHMKRRHNMNMSKRKPVHTSEETAENMKK